MAFWYNGGMDARHIYEGGYDIYQKEVSDGRDCEFTCDSVPCLAKNPTCQEYGLEIVCPNCNRTIVLDVTKEPPKQALLRRQRLQHEALMERLDKLANAIKPSVDLQDFIAAFAQEKKDSLLV